MAVPRFFANGFKKIELIGDGCARFTFCDNRASGNGSCKRVTGEWIVPLSALPQMLAQMNHTLVRGASDAKPGQDEAMLH